MLSIMRKHAQSWIIKVALFAIAIVFIFWGVGSFRSDRSSRLAKVNGKAISVQEFQEAYRQAGDRFKDLYGQPMDEKTFYSKEFKQKVLEGLIEKQLVQEAAREMGFSVTEAELSRSIQQIPYFQENGKFSPVKYRRVLQMNRMTPEAFEADQNTTLLQKRVSDFLKGFVKTDQEEVRQFFSFLNDEMNAYFFMFSKDEYKSQIVLTPEQIKTFFSQNQNRFRTPVQVRAAYWIAKPKDFENQVTVSEKEIQSYYQQNEKRFVDTKTNQPLPLEKVKEAIRTQLAADKAHELAAQKAETVYDQILTKGSLKVFEREFKVPIQETDWMTAGERRSGLEGVSEFSQKVFSLKKGELTPILDLGPEWGFAVLQVTERKESQAMTLEQAESRVREELQEEKAAAKALSEAETFLSELHKKKDVLQVARDKNRKADETGFFSRIKNRPPWADTAEGQEILFSIGPSSPVPDKPLKLGKDNIVIIFKESRPASLEEFQKDQEKVAQALQQQKQTSLFQEWSRYLRKKAKVNINQDLL